MAVHPPMLYLGYVGMAVPFAFAMSALMVGARGTEWLASHAEQVKRVLPPRAVLRRLFVTKGMRPLHFQWCMEANGGPRSAMA